MRKKALSPNVFNYASGKKNDNSFQKSFIKPGAFTSKKDFKREENFMDYKVGDIVEHKLWEKGEILRIKKITDDLEMDIAFKTVGLKKLLASIAPIKKEAK